MSDEISGTPAPRLERRRSRITRTARRLPPGAAPGTLVADPDAPKPVIHILSYGPDGVEEHEVSNPRDLSGLTGRHAVDWINIDGLGDADVIAGLGEVFGLHRLALEDVLHVHQRPKIDDYEKYLFIVFRMVEDDTGLPSEQISMFLSKGTIITFQERPGDSFDPVRERLRSGRGMLRGMGADYLAYAIMDIVVDRYFPALEAYEDQLDALTEETLSRPQPALMRRLHQIKRDLFHFRRTVWSFRELLNNLLRDSHPSISGSIQPFLRDTYDHCVQLMEMLEMQREVAASLFDIYLSSLSNRLNEVLKVLTMISTVFIPLGFIASLYGMNFDRNSPWNMPELGWRYGYFYALGVMAVIAVGLCVWFWTKGWIGSGDHRPRRRPRNGNRRKRAARDG